MKGKKFYSYMLVALIGIALFVLGLAIFSIDAPKQLTLSEMIVPLVVESESGEWKAGDFHHRGKVFGGVYKFSMRIHNPTPNDYSLVLWCEGYDKRGNVVERIELEHCIGAHEDLYGSTYYMFKKEFIPKLESFRYGIDITRIQPVVKPNTI